MNTNEEHFLGQSLYEVYPPNSKVSEGYNDPMRLQNVSKLKKTGPKILLFWTPWDIW